MHDKIENVAHAVTLSRRARAIIRQNLIISMGVVLLLVISALGNKIGLSLGVIGHEGSTVVVVLNGLRLLRWNIGFQPVT
jgi:Cd2+/Zn2+-exporting ATPase